MTQISRVYDKLCEIDGQYVIVFHAFPPMFIVENDDVITVQWTIFKKI